MNLHEAADHKRPITDQRVASSSKSAASLDRLDSGWGDNQLVTIFYLSALIFFSHLLDFIHHLGKSSLSFLFRVPSPGLKNLSADSELRL